MKNLNPDSGYIPRKKSWLFTAGAVTVAASSLVMLGCSDNSSSTSDGGSATVPTVTEPARLALKGTALACDTSKESTSITSDTAATLQVDPEVGRNSIPSYNVSREEAKFEIPASEYRANAQNRIKRLSAVVPAVTPGGEEALDDEGVPLGDVHPILITYAEQVIGGYVGGDGSADLADPDHIDDMFASLSMDNGKTWKKMPLAETSKESSIAVNWGDESTAYPGHSHKPSLQVQGDNILVAWNDKYCPSSNPFGLEKDEDNTEVPYPDDLYKINGAQGSVDYDGLIAPNNEPLYEVPFSCVWTARGVLVDDIDGDGETGDYGIEWREAQQLTSGTRDSNKIWIASAPVGFALSWQEDPEGLRSGKGAGPGVGYSGATTNHGADIWYSFIKTDDFDNVCVDPNGADDIGNTEDDCAEIITGDEVDAVQQIANLETKLVPAVNFKYPVRISNNEVCAGDASGNVSDDENKLYCGALTEVDDPDTEVVETTEVALNCIDTVSHETGSQGNSQTVYRCVQADLDYMTDDTSIEPQNAVLDGDTGASRPAMTILQTNEGEFVTILVYEETKGLSVSDPGDGTGNTGEDIDETDIALEGKSVNFESFLWDQPVTVSAGRIVNLRVPEAIISQDDTTHELSFDGLTGDMIYENARRVVIGTQVDSCDAAEGSGNPTFALIYKQGYDVQGGSSDMFVRKNYGFTYDDFETVTVDGVEEPVAYNVSSRKTKFDDQDPAQPTGAIEWSENNLEDQSYDYPEDNTFSPRIFLRADEVIAGFEFTSVWRRAEQGTMPNNFWIHRYANDGNDKGLAWQGPQQVSIVYGPQTSTLDPRFHPAPKGSFDKTSLESDKSNPDVMFLTWGTFDMQSGHELDLFYTRSTDNGQTWEYYVDDGGTLRAATTADYGVDGLPGTADDALDVKASMLAHRDYAAEMELQTLVSPDGNMLFNAWLYETEEGCGGEECGLESKFTRVDYDTPIATTP